MEDLEKNKKRINIKHFLIIILILIIVIAVIISINEFSFKKEYEPPTALKDELPRFRLIDMDNIGITGDEDNDGINDQKDILSGARKQLEKPARNIFLEENEPNYYQGGDPPENLAISTDIIARAFREAGFDLRELVYEDIKENFDQYPLKKTGARPYAIRILIIEEFKTWRFFSGGMQSLWVLYLKLQM